MLTLNLSDYEAEWLREHLDILLPLTSTPSVVNSIFQKLGGFADLDKELDEEAETPEYRELIQKIALGQPLD